MPRSRRQDPWYEAFGARLKKAIGAAGLSQTEVAARMKVHRSTVTHWIAGSVPGPPDIARLAGVLGTTREDLLSGRPSAGEVHEETAPYGFESEGEQFTALPAAAGRVGAGPARLDPSDQPRRYAFHKDWFQRKRLKPDNIVIVQVAKGQGGESMEPIIRPGSVLAVDRGPHSAGVAELRPQDEGRVFLVKRPGDDGMMVKRVYRAKDALVFWSDNPNTTPRVEVVPLKGQRLQDIILGRVVWIGREEE